jgi:hypothetical protein
VNTIGAKRWAIAEGYIPPYGHGPGPQLASHETVCMLNVNDQDAKVVITVYFSDREPGGPYRITVPARRTRHVRFNNLNDPEPIPKDTDFASVIESDVPIVVQHTRLDSRQAESALLSSRKNPHALVPGREIVESQTSVPSDSPDSVGTVYAETSICLMGAAIFC